MTIGAVITVNQNQYEMVRGEVSSLQDIHISEGKETADGDIYIIPFIPITITGMALIEQKKVEQLAI